MMNLFLPIVTTCPATMRLDRVLELADMPMVYLAPICSRVMLIIEAFASATTDPF